MELLFSNYPPVQTECSTFSEAFYGLLPETSRLDIAVGYISGDSLIELQKILEFNPKIRTLNLIIGMHYFDLFTRPQYETALGLNDFLIHEGRGEVRLVNAFRYHGKLYLYRNEEGAFAGIIGSDNLNSIVDDGIHQYESSVLLREPAPVNQMSNFITRLIDTSSKNITELKINTFNTQNMLLEGQEHVEKVSTSRLADAVNKRTGVSFKIPIKTTPKSNLNVFFGKGRESRNGLVKPRHWYEVELIVPNSVTSMVGYPDHNGSDKEFTVITDDGWSFKCKVSGDHSKNFRSSGDLKILGRWLKGRLENAGALQMGTPVTQQTLQLYGRDNFTLTKTSEEGLWLLDFGV